MESPQDNSTTIMTVRNIKSEDKRKWKVIAATNAENLGEALNRLIKLYEAQHGAIE